MKEKYPFSEIEERWRAYWRDNGLFAADTSKVEAKFYCLMMFPYPSASLHVGHGRNYIIGDAVARYKKMCGMNVLAPMGWDAFGLPAENAAIKSGIPPRESTLSNIATMKRQLDSWGVCYDWDREVSSCMPDYYRWTQWIFLKLHEKGLAYRGKAAVNWCPSCATVLANEQVVDGLCERCESEVEQKWMEQWFFKITDYAQRLLDDLEKLEGWPDRVKTMQRNWIGRSEGTRVDFKLVPRNDAMPEAQEIISCFTTRVDTIYGCTYMVIAPECPELKSMVSGLSEEQGVLDYVGRASKISARDRTADGLEKTGVFTGRYVENPYNGEHVPVWVADYVLMEYGSGAVMAVPAHDTRDWAFAKKYGLKIRISIQNPEHGLDLQHMVDAYCEDGTVVDSGPFSGMANREAISAMTKHATDHGFGGAMVHFRLRDWLISRQRYWGAPIPIIYCDRCGTVPVPESDLPILLPENVVFGASGESPLAGSEEFIRANCPKCGGPGRRESDTMDTFVDSSWYFLRYLSARDESKAFDRETCDNWLPVDQYIGGIEHAILHLMYARFLTKVLCDFGLIGFDEPFAHLFTQGMICKRSEKDGQLYKMSKSKGNVVSPDSLIARYGADTVRLYTLFIGPPEKDAEWNDQGIEGASRFLRRLWRRVYEKRDILRSASTVATDSSGMGEDERQLWRKTHESIRNVTRDIDSGFHFNTAVSEIMELMNAIDHCDIDESSDSLRKNVYREAIETVILLLSPFSPHISEELWEELGHEPSVLKCRWPAANDAAMERQEAEIAVQVNGKLRGRLTVGIDLDDKQLESSVMAWEGIQKYVKGKQIRKVIIIKNKLVNVVVT